MLQTPRRREAAVLALGANLHRIGAADSAGEVTRILAPEASFYRTAGKRILDVVFASAVLTVVAPILLFMCLLVRLESEGPAFFVTSRVGRDGRPVRQIKVRTMYVLLDEGGARFAARNDSRVTRVGAFLRRMSLDELPLLLNVLRGDYAMVGPRPLLPSRMEAMGWHGYPLALELRQKVRPGVLSPAMLEFRGRGTLSTETEAAMDIAYVVNCSLWEDLRILARSVRYVLAPPSAY